MFGKRDKSLPTLIMELKDLSVDYAKQETWQPVKNLGRYIAFGLAGSIVLGIGLLLWVVAILRILQNETAPHFNGNLSWLPYLLTLLICAVVIALSVSAIFSEKRQAKRRHKKLAREQASQHAGHAQ